MCPLQRIGDWEVGRRHLSPRVSGLGVSPAAGFLAFLSSFSELAVVPTEPGGLCILVSSVLGGGAARATVPRFGSVCHRDFGPEIMVRAGPKSPWIFRSGGPKSPVIVGDNGPTLDILVRVAIALLQWKSSPNTPTNVATCHHWRYTRRNEV